jgi:hypothetical protein
MEFLPGAFERDWERRRAALLHELQMGMAEELDWDMPRRGGVARLPEEAPPGARRAGGSGGGRLSLRARGSGSGRPMRSRFEALARGSQPAVVKLASYGGGARAASMMSYVSRNGELTVENEAGERVAGKAALAELRSEWEPLFDNRAASRDIGMFSVRIEALAEEAGGADRDELVREILRTGFSDRRFVYAVEEKPSREIEISGIVVLRDSRGERLTADRTAAAIVQERFDAFGSPKGVEASFLFHGYGNGVEYGTSRLRDLVERFHGEVRDETGNRIGNPERAGDLVQKEWRSELHSRKGRDVMHLVLSARAGTDASAFNAAVRDFLGDKFAGHRYVFALHGPSDDPKESVEGGRRPHVHAHTIVTMRSETGERLETSPQVFRHWRAAMAEKAREHGIAMEMTDRRELASAPAYTRNQVRPVNYAGRTEHEGTSEAAQVRYDAKRGDRQVLSGSDRSREYAAAATEVWRELAQAGGGRKIAEYASLQLDRIHAASSQSQINYGNIGNEPDTSKIRSNVTLLGELTSAEEDHMREMTRPEFEAYESRVEAVLSDVERSLEAREREDFDEIAAAAREVVSIRREYLEFTEQQVTAHNRGAERPESENEVWERTDARHGEEVVQRGNDVMVEVDTARESIERAKEDGRDAASAKADLERDLGRAARLAVEGNSWLREIAETDRDLRQAIETEELRHGREPAGDDRKPERASNGGDNHLGTSSDDRVSDAVRSSSSAQGAGGVEAEQLRELSREDRSDTATEDQAEDRHDARPFDHERRPRTNEERATPVRSADERSARSDPPQQHLPRLREIEREIDERNERDRDDRDR